MSSPVPSSLPSRHFKVAAVQASSIYHDSAANLKRAVLLMEEAAAEGAKLVVFSELWLSGYPFWCWMMSYGETVPLIKNYYLNGAVEADGPESRIFSNTCRRLGIRGVLGIAERDHGSLYMSQWICGPDGSLITRRKLKPSIMERVLFGEGDGSDIKVHETEVGRLGALQCWEHAQPLLKHTMGMQHEEIHCASWPSFPPELPHFSLSAEANASVIQTYAVEVGAYVISASANLSRQNQDYVCEGREHLREHFPLGCALTQIYNPEGRQLAKRPAHDEETIIYADIDLDICFTARAAMDPSGHYARSDVFEVHFNNTPRRGLRVGPHDSRGTASGGMRVLRRQLFGESLAAETENTPGDKSG